MDLNVPTINATTIRAWLRGADPRRVDPSKLISSFSLPSIELPSKASIDDAGKTAASLASDAGKQAAVLAGDAGKAAMSAASDAGRVLTSVIETAGDRLRDLRATVTPPPKRPSVVKRGVVALAAASILGSIAAAAAFLLHPVRGAARRTAIRRRLGIGAGMTRSGVGTAVVAARRATGRATELVRIPIESARDMVGSRNGHADNVAELTDKEAVLVAVGVDSGVAAIGEPNNDIAHVPSASRGDWDDAVETAADAGATSESSTGQSAKRKKRGDAEQRAEVEAVGE